MYTRVGTPGLVPQGWYLAFSDLNFIKKRFGLLSQTFANRSPNGARTGECPW